MNKLIKKDDEFNVLRAIDKFPHLSQRKLAHRLEISLGKLNYCLRALQAKGFVKFTNFKNNEKKINYIYLITPKGIKEKTLLTIQFMKKKFKEYDELRNELENLKNK